MTGDNSGIDYEKAIAERDEKIASLETQVAEAAKTAEAAERLRCEIAELKAQGESDRIDFKLQLAGVRNVKAARALLGDHGNDVDKLKEAEPWLFEGTGKHAKGGSAGGGTTGLPNAGAASDEGKTQSMNVKEEWSIVRYIGSQFGGDPLAESSDLTKGRCYYWPCSKAHPVYEGVIDNMENTSYLYPCDPESWEIVSDPLGLPACMLSPNTARKPRATRAGKPRSDGWEAYAAKGRYDGKQPWDLKAVSGYRYRLQMQSGRHMSGQCPPSRSRDTADSTAG